MRIVRGSHPEPKLVVRSTQNGVLVVVTASNGAAMVVKGEAELVGELDGETQAAFDAATVHALSIPAVARIVGA